MKRLVDHYLYLWKDDSRRKPLLLRGARQVGKTYAARQLGKKFSSFVEINLEAQSEARAIFVQNLDPHRIVLELSSLVNQPIVPGKTLLFLDEIQAYPRALTALRYMYEMMPELHVIAAGSLLDFAIGEVGIPVGRVESLYVYPVSFLESLANEPHGILFNEIINMQNAPLSEIAHQKLLESLRYYLAVGGMPEAMQVWIETEDPFAVSKIHHQLLEAYRQDFVKYAKNHQIKYVENIFRSIPEQLGGKFKYTRVEGEFRKRELSPALDLLQTAGIAHKVYSSSGQGIPLGAQSSPFDYKVLFLDVGLAQASLGLNLGEWYLQRDEAFINKGALVENFVGQEMLVYADAHRRQQLFYWERQAKSSQAEVDYLIQKDRHIIPVEVKSGPGTALKSMRLFLDSHAATPYGIRFSTQPYSLHENLHSYPLYSIAQVCAENDRNTLEAIKALST